MSIPRLIFQTWKSKTDLPANMKKWHDDAAIVNPGYEVILWDDDDNRRFVEEYFPWFLPTYDAFPAEIYRVDAVRPLFLYKFGGFYADLDVEFLRPFDQLGQIDKGVVLGSMGVNPNFPHSIPNAIMGSSPGEEFWLYYVGLMMEADPSRRPEYVTGPVILKNAYDAYTQRYASDEVQRVIHRVVQERHVRSDVYLLSGNIFYPLDWNDRIHDEFRQKVLKEPLTREEALNFFPGSVTVTYWTHSWE